MDKKENKKMSEEQLGVIHGGWSQGCVSGSLWQITCNHCSYKSTWCTNYDDLAWFKNFHTSSNPAHTSYKEEHIINP